MSSFLGAFTSFAVYLIGEDSFRITAWMMGFVGLIIPHTLRMALRTSSNAVLIPASALTGGLFLLFCDVIAKNILSPVEIPIGVVTSFFGAPFFLYLAFRKYA